MQFHLRRDVKHPEEFDTAFMNALFRYGYERGRNGYPWRKLPPRFAPE